MRERLREISELTFLVRIIFFGKKANIIPDFQQSFEHLHCFNVASLQFVIVC